MGRHSSSDQIPFYRSAAAWFLPWVVIAAVVGIAVWIAVDAVSDESLSNPPVAARSTPSPQASPTAPPATPLAATSTSDSATARPAKDRAAALITEGIRVQVLNGTASPDAHQQMAEKLARLGFDVVAVEMASETYSETTVFWSFDAAREAAERLAAKFGWIAAERPSNLSAAVDIHLVVGVDEA